MPERTKCFVCSVGIRENQKPYRRIPNSELWTFIQGTFDGLQDDHRLCPKCYKQQQREFARIREPERTESSSNRLALSSTPSTQNCCFICKNPEGRCRIEESAIINLWFSEEIVVPHTNRCCKEHVNAGRFTSEAIEKLKQSCKEQDMTPEEFKKLVKEMVNRRTSTLDFSTTSSTDNFIYETWLGFGRCQFLELCSLYFTPFCKDLKNICPENALALFLTKLRMCLSLKAVGQLYGLQNAKQRASEIFEMVREILNEHFVPLHIGYQHITREDYIKIHGTILSQLLLNVNSDVAIWIMDGTYLYIQKSTNYEVQRNTYSLHKFQNLVKPMMVVAPDGYILAVEGLYFADGSHNDAAITKHMALDPEGFATFFEEQDAVIYDRGFRDCSALMKSLGFQDFMPNLLGKKKQFTTEEANESRLVTKLRWVVESVNGRLKNKFAFFNNKINNKYVNKLASILQIACALMNKYCPPLNCNKPEHLALARRMRDRSNLTNLLQQYLEKEGILKKKVVWSPINADELSEFPILSEEDIRELSMGVYQLKQARSYLAENFTEEDPKNIWYHKENSCLLRLKMHSRHRRNSYYQCWVQYRSGFTGAEAIGGWFCTCNVGARTLGCCSHVAASLYYLGHARSLETIQHPARDIASSIINLRAS